MKRYLSFIVVLLLLSPAAFAGVFENWSQINNQNCGTYADTNGSKVEYTGSSGPNGTKAIKITSSVIQGGWCGIWHSFSADLSKFGFLRFKIKSIASGTMEMALRDAYNFQYITSFQIYSKDWEEVTISFSSFKKDPSYTPPDAITGHPMDLSRTKGMNLASQIAGDSVVEIGPIEAFKTITPADTSSFSKGKIVEDWYRSPFQMQGTYADTMGSRIDSVIEDGPDGRS